MLLPMDKGHFVLRFLFMLPDYKHCFPNSCCALLMVFMSLELPLSLDDCNVLFMHDLRFLYQSLWGRLSSCTSLPSGVDHAELFCLRLSRNTTKSRRRIVILRSSSSLVTGTRAPLMIFSPKCHGSLFLWKIKGRHP
jgi:hypothetical protein